MTVFTAMASMTDLFVFLVALAFALGLLLGRWDAMTDMKAQREREEREDDQSYLTTSEERDQQILTPVELPEDLISKPEIHLRDLKPGESAWIKWLDMVVDPDHHCFLNPEAEVYAEESFARIRATCTEAGFEVFIPFSTVAPLQWNPGEFSVGEDYFPVLRLERCY